MDARQHPSGRRSALDSWQPSTLSWSFSRKTHFDSCKRHYFYHRFWGQDPRLRWRLFTMRHITTLTMLRGQVVHSVIAGALASVRSGVPVDIETARRNVTGLMRERYMESYHRLWHVDNRPRDRRASSITNLLEHFYGFPEVKERARDARDVAWRCVENLFASEFWQSIAASDPEGWREVESDGFPSFDLDGIMVYAGIDFAHSNGAPTIIDWKTGAPGSDDRDQLALYSLYAQSKWGWDPLETRLIAAYLQPEFSAEAFTPSAGDVEAVRDGVKSSFAAMLELEPAFGPAKIEDFPMTGEPHDCRWCRFQGVCEGAKRHSAADEQQAAEVS